MGDFFTKTRILQWKIFLILRACEVGFENYIQLRHSRCCYNQAYLKITLTFQQHK